MRFSRDILRSRSLMRAGPRRFVVGLRFVGAAAAAERFILGVDVDLAERRLGADAGFARFEAEGAARVEALRVPVVVRLAVAARLPAVFFVVPRVFDVRATNPSPALVFAYHAPCCVRKQHCDFVH